MAAQERMSERRKYKRFPLKEGVFAVMGPNHAKLGQITDISMGGVGFRYVNGDSAAPDSTELDMFCADNAIYLDKIPIKTVTDSVISDGMVFSTIKMRRRGVQFTELTPEQKTQLEIFIRNNSAIAE